MDRGSRGPRWIYDGESDEWLSVDEETVLDGELVELTDRALGYERLQSELVLEDLVLARLKMLCDTNEDTFARERCLILIVDDDDSLRSIIAEFLADMDDGYHKSLIAISGGDGRIRTGA